MNEKVVVRYTVPTRYDNGPYGQICRVEGDGSKYYIQISKKEEENKWLSLGEFLENVFKTKILDVDGLFIQKCLKEYIYYE